MGGFGHRGQGQYERLDAKDQVRYKQENKEQLCLLYREGYLQLPPTVSCTKQEDELTLFPQHNLCQQE